MSNTFVSPYLNFDGNAREAMEFYRTVFGGTLELMRYDALDMGAELSPADAAKIMHGSLESESGPTLMGADVPPGTDYRPGSAVTVALTGDDAGTLRGWWEKLSSGGTVTVPMDRQPWGDEFGACTDAYGIDWLVNISTD
ncbi:VOC family protein [Streptomyces sp. UH6]|uniref:VOC family protein n=1 Tax=Streptomyces sp. UH6 TaxID=2748379 RepID=UPI0015D4FC23|nr:VOC family protein [Streptomyces sp. UH6]NYV76398.1 VOC family protein [Streptomyces sp. UH6]